MTNIENRSKLIQKILDDGDWNDLSADALLGKARKAEEAVHDGWISYAGVLPKAEALRRKIAKAAAQCPGAFAKIHGALSFYRYAEIHDALDSAAVKKLVESGELKWQMESGSHELGRSAPANLARSLLLLLVDAAAEEWKTENFIGKDFARLSLHLSHSPGGAKAKEGALRSAVKWIEEHHGRIKAAPIKSAEAARLKRVLRAVGEEPETTAFTEALAQAKAKAAASGQRQSSGDLWGAPAAWAIRDDSDHILEHLRQGAALAGVDFATQAFAAPEGQPWNKPKPNPRWAPPAQTLLEIAIDKRAECCALALAALPGASRPYFDDAGQSIRRNPLGGMRPALSTDGAKGPAAERLLEISRLLAEDLLARGVERSLCAQAVAASADKALSIRDSGSAKATAGKASVVRAAMRQAAFMSDWARAKDGAPAPAPKARAKSL